MKRKTKVKSERFKICSKCRFNQQSLILGLIHDLFMLIKVIFSIISWPVHTLSRVVQDQVKKVPQLHVSHVRAIICILIGLAVIGVTYLAEHLFDHSKVWLMSIETARAAGVCPIWETIAATLKIGAEFEG